jgi:hypothetical protein
LRSNAARVSLAAESRWKDAACPCSCRDAEGTQVSASEVGTNMPRAARPRVPRGPELASRRFGGSQLSARTKDAIKRSRGFIARQESPEDDSQIALDLLSIAVFL